MTIFNTRDFHWDPKTLTFSAEASTLGFTKVPAGGMLQSHVSGATLPLHYVGADIDREGEVCGWRYEVVHGYSRMKVLIIND